MIRKLSLLDDYADSSKSCNCEICLRARWHKEVNESFSVPEDIKLMLNWYWDVVESLTTELDCIKHKEQATFETE